MNLKKDMITALNKHFLGATTIDKMVTYLNSQGHNCNKRTCMIHIRRTLKINKPERKSDYIEYIKNPKLPREYKNILKHNVNPENMEELFFYFLLKFGYVPTYDIFKNYTKQFKFKFTWNTGNFQVLKNKVLRIIEETKTRIELL